MAEDEAALDAPGAADCVPDDGGLLPELVRLADARDAELEDLFAQRISVKLRLAEHGELTSWKDLRHSGAIGSCLSCIRTRKATQDRQIDGLPSKDMLLVGGCVPHVVGVP